MLFSNIKVHVFKGADVKGAVWSKISFAQPKAWGLKFAALFFASCAYERFLIAEHVYNPYKVRPLQFDRKLEPITEITLLNKLFP